MSGESEASEQDVNLTGHARQRMAQRNVRLIDLDYVLRHGRRLRKPGSLYVFLGRRDVPEEDRAGRGWQLIGTTVVMSEDEAVITVYRNPRAIGRLKKRSRR